MFDLSIYDYEKVQDFLNKNIKKRNIIPCVPIKKIETESYYNLNYKLIIVSIDYEYFDDPNKSFQTHDVPYEKSYYYILEYNDESFLNELSVIDCGGYYLAVCIFLDNVNVTNNYINNMNTKIGTKYEMIKK